MSRGFLIYAHNNSSLDYGLIALCNALMIKHNLKHNSVTLITDDGTLQWLQQSQPAELLGRAFDNIVIQSWEQINDGVSTRRFQDTPSTHHQAPWYNGTRRTAFALSPYDQTVLIDSDYLVCDNLLDMVWDTHENYLMNKTAVSLTHNSLDAGDTHLDPFTIPMYWATCVYFDRSARSQLLFDMVDLVREQYEFFQFVYGFKGKIYRNDYAFSIATHILNGFQNVGSKLDLPFATLRTSFDRDELLSVPGLNQLTLFVNDTAEPWQFRLTTLQNTSVHVLNKFSIVRNSARIIELYGCANG